MTTKNRISLLVFALAVSAGTYHVTKLGFAQEGPDWNNGLPRQHESKWLVHDINRPLPKTVTPGSARGVPPADAIVLFDGKDLSKWTGNDGNAGWAVRDGYMEANNAGSISTRESFADCQLHIEYMAPTPPKKVSQGRGNSGIFFQSRYEVQVLDNYDNKTYADGYIGAVYGQHPPLVNAGRKPGEWQTYDLVYRAPRFADGKVKEEGRVTVLLNGIVVQHDAKIFGSTVWRQKAKYGAPHGPAPIQLQDHGDRQKVRFRNIWIRKLDLSPEAIDNQK